ncbi:MAG: hypothetical protein DRI57_06420 [Deltaproteobacteria bacterium]|nr:MAG: hypothetical protein DRI57_06420 [Deltaproteobacteria bacterium]
MGPKMRKFRLALSPEIMPDKRECKNGAARRNFCVPPNCKNSVMASFPHSPEIMPGKRECKNGAARRNFCVPPNCENPVISHTEAQRKAYKNLCPKICVRLPGRTAPDRTGLPVGRAVFRYDQTLPSCIFFSSLI